MRRPVSFSLWCAAARALLWPIAAGAAPCVVEWDATLPAAYQNAVRELDPEATGTDDCRSVRVRSEEGGARLVLITRDGRRVERRVDAPGELASTLAALRVTVEDDRRDAGEPPATPPSTPVVETAPIRPPAADTGPSKNATGRDDVGDRNGTLFALTAGVRGGDNALFSPVVSGAISLLRSGWEIGVLGALDLRYASVSGAEPTVQGAGAIAAGIFAGRRAPVGNVDLLGGARLSVAALFYDEDVSAPAPPGPSPSQEPQHGGPAEARVGAYLGAAFPRSSTVRFRCDLAADAVVDSDPALPITPRWAMSALLGVEFKAL
jgi:hypothetical protein